MCEIVTLQYSRYDSCSRYMIKKAKLSPSIFEEAFGMRGRTPPKLHLAQQLTNPPPGSLPEQMIR